jgi:hypothetical protein
MKDLDRDKKLTGQIKIGTVQDRHRERTDQGRGRQSRKGII